uniref:Uncharacterized protein n=1 Tax=Timema monikensis TaxID=170555 RepID=A0A7R9HRA0_9NEOP|nr:unnamed protein product [Timema monikensis]
MTDPMIGKSDFEREFETGREREFETKKVFETERVFGGEGDCESRREKFVLSSVQCQTLPHTPGPVDFTPAHNVKSF